MLSLEAEIWRPVVGFEGAYEVSDLGRVRSVARVIPCRVGKGPRPDRVILRRQKGVILRPAPNPNGYPGVAIGTLGINRGTHAVHKLVLTAFVGPRPEGHECRHLDGCRTNARLGNLAWGTSKENSADTFRHGRRHLGSDYRNAKLDLHKAAKIRALRGCLTQSELAEMFEVSPAAIQAVHDGRTWKHAEARPC